VADRESTATRASLASRRLYLCTPDRPDLRSFLVACIDGGVDLVQLRDKTLEARPLLDRASVASGVCRERGVPFILNDRPDLALACGADGVHVGQDDVPPAVARRILGPDAIVGLSTHAPPEWDAAAGEPVDYYSAGPVSPTPTKPGRPGTGLGYLSYVASTGRGQAVPWFVTGGATPETIPAMADAGARRFVVVRYLTESPDPAAAARRLRQVIDRFPLS
jgi:thiamine-phosphate pyrophosphorylase